MDRVKLQVSVREGRGSKDAKALRAAGEIPGVIYSATTDTQAITVNARALRQAVAGGLHTTPFAGGSCTSTSTRSGSTRRSRR